MKYLILFLISLNIAFVNAQMVYTKLKLDKGEKGYDIVGMSLKYGLKVLSYKNKTKEYFIHTQKGKYGPYQNVWEYAWDGLAMVGHKKDGDYLLFMDKEYGPYDSIPENGQHGISQNLKNIAFEIIEHQKRYIVNASNGNKFGPITGSVANYFQISDDGTKILYQVHKDYNSYLYEDDSLLTSGYTFSESGYAPDGSAYYIVRNDSGKWVTFAGGVRKTYPRDSVRIDQRNFALIFNERNKKYECIFCNFEYNEESNALVQFSKTDSGYYLVGKYWHSSTGPYEYVEHTLRGSSYTKQYGFITKINGSFFLHLNDTILGPFSHAPEIVFCQPRKVILKESWAYKTVKDGLFYITTDTRTLGPYKKVSEMRFCGPDSVLVYRAKEMNDSVMLHVGNQSLNCLSLEGDFCLASDGKEFIFDAVKDGKKFRWIRGEFYETGRYNRLKINHYSPKTGQYIELRDEGYLECLYINNEKKECYKQIGDVGITEAGSVYYEATLHDSLFLFINGIRHGPFNNLSRRYQIRTDPPLYVLAKLENFDYLIFETNMYGPTKPLYGFNNQEPKVSKDFQRIAYLQDRDSQHFIFVNERAYGPHQSIGDFQLTAGGLSYYAMDDSSHLTLYLNNKKISFLLNASQFRSLKYNSFEYDWDNDILLYYLPGQDGYFTSNLYFKGKSYLGKFLDYTDGNFAVYIKGNKLMYRKL